MKNKKDSDISKNTVVLLKSNFELEKFHTNHGYNEYLIITDERHYKINEATFNLIQVIKRNINLESIASEYSFMQKKEYSIQDISHIIDNSFAPLGIIASSSVKTKEKTKSFLWIRIPIFSEKFLMFFTSFLKHLFKPNIAKVVLFLIAVGHYYIFVNYLKTGYISDILVNPLFMLASGLILLVSAIFHEFGHVAACRYYGVKHKAVGFGLYLIFPVFYSDISDAWRIEAKKRAVIDIAGLYFQLIFNLILFAIYLLFSQNDILLISIKLVLFQTIIVLNPFFRFDGYWLATDLLGIANLRRRSVEFIQYIINKYILKRNPPEFKLEVNKSSKFAFILYAFISNIFIGYFIILIFSRMPDMIIEFPGFSRNAINIIVDSYYLDDWKNIGLNLYQFFMKILFMFISFYFVYRISKTLIKTFNSGYPD